MGFTGTAILTDAAIGAAVGGGVSAVTGGDIGKGALMGGLTGGFVPAGGEFIGGIGGEAIGGAVGGGLGAELTGGNVLEGALMGGAAGGIAGISGVGGGTDTAPPAAGVPEAGVAAPAAGPSAASTASGLGIDAGAAPIDLTAAPVTDTTSAFPTAGAGVTGGVTGAAPDVVPAATATDTASALGIPTGAGTTTAPDVTGAAPAAGGAPPPSMWDKLVSGAESQVTKNPLGLAVSGVGLAKDLATGGQLPPQAGKLQSQADALAAQGNLLSSYIQSGTLPPGAQTAIDQATASAKAAIRSKYASLGQSGSSAEIQDLNNIDMAAKTQGFNIASQLLASGISETGLSADIYKQLLTATSAQDKQLGDAISNFAVAASGGPQIRLPSGG